MRENEFAGKAAMPQEREPGVEKARRRGEARRCGAADALAVEPWLAR